MKFAVSREDLLKPLQLVAGVVERRQTMPVLSNLCLAVAGQKLLMTGTDLEVQLVAEITLTEPAAQDGEITVPPDFGTFTISAMMVAVEVDEMCPL